MPVHINARRRETIIQQGHGAATIGFALLENLVSEECVTITDGNAEARYKELRARSREKKAIDAHISFSSE